MISSYLEATDTDTTSTEISLEEHPRLINVSMREMYLEATKLTKQVDATTTTIEYLNRNTTTLTAGRRYYNTTTPLHKNKNMVAVSGNESFLESAKKMIIDLFKQIGKMLKAIGKFIMDVINAIVKFIKGIFKSKKDTKKQVKEVETKYKYIEKEAKSLHKNIKDVSNATSEKIQDVVENGVDMKKEMTNPTNEETKSLVDDLREYNVLMYLKHYYDNELVINFLRLGVEIRSTYVNYAGGMLIKIPYMFTEQNEDIRYNNTNNLRNLFCVTKDKMETGEMLSEKEINGSFRIFSNYLESLMVLIYQMPPLYKEVDPTEKGFKGANEIVEDIKKENNLDKDTIVILVSINTTEIKYLTIGNDESADSLMKIVNGNVEEVKNLAKESKDLGTFLDNVDKAFKIMIETIKSFTINYHTWRPVVTEEEIAIFFREKEFLHKSAVQRVLPEIVLQSGRDEMTIKDVKDFVTNNKGIEAIEKDIDNITDCISELENVEDDQIVRKMVTIGNDFKITLNSLYKNSLENMKIFRDLVKDGDETYEDILMIQKKITNIMIEVIRDFKNQAST